TYSFDATAPASDLDHIAASAWATFTPFTAAQQAQAQAALQEWSDASGVVFRGPGILSVGRLELFDLPPFRHALARRRQHPDEHRLRDRRRVRLRDAAARGRARAGAEASLRGLDPVRHVPRHRAQ